MLRWLALCFLLAANSACAEQSAIKWKSIREIRQHNIQRQTLDYSCGVASLSILLSQYFLDNKSEKDLLADIVFRLSKNEMLERVTQGFSMLDLKNQAERLGYSADGVLISIESASKLKGPVIILLRRGEVNHFAILKGIANGRAFLADPARGNIRIPLYALGEEWRGEALIVGREGFGLPVHHGLAVSRNAPLISEIDTARALLKSKLEN